MCKILWLKLTRIVTYFTNLIYASIQFAVGNGDCAPVSCELRIISSSANLFSSLVTMLSCDGRQSKVSHSREMARLSSGLMIMVSDLLSIIPQCADQRQSLRISICLYDCKWPTSSSVSLLTIKVASRRVSPLPSTMSLLDGRSMLMDVTNWCSILSTNGCTRDLSPSFSGNSFLVISR